MQTQNTLKTKRSGINLQRNLCLNGSGFLTLFSKDMMQKNSIKGNDDMKIVEFQALAFFFNIPRFSYCQVFTEL